MTRREEIEAGLAATRRRIAEACAAAGRDPSEVTLVVVTKFFPASDVRILADLGVTHVGENRHQEAQAKQLECADLGLCWHFIGQIQTNKARAVAGYADVVSSVDSTKLADALGRGAAGHDRTVECLVQVNLDPEGDPARGGVPEGQVLEVAERVAAHDHLRLRGVMAVAPLGSDPRRAFADLARSAAAVREFDPEASWISAGMSGDLEDAVAEGATHVRVGSAVLGSRPVLG